jgi:hypothetical protein
VDRNGSPFSQEQCIRPTLLSQRERLPCTACHERVGVVDI